MRHDRYYAGVGVAKRRSKGRLSSAGSRRYPGAGVRGVQVSRCRYCLIDDAWPGLDLSYCKLAKLYVWPGQECMAAPRVRQGDGTCFGTGSRVHDDYSEAYSPIGRVPYLFLEHYLFEGEQLALFEALQTRARRARRDSSDSPPL